VRAVVLRKPGVLELSDVPMPTLKAEHDILVRVEACGICGSDLRYSAGENPWALHTLGRHIPNPPNIILGHEYAGVVVEVNSKSFEHLLGRRVGVQAFRVCGDCQFCRTGFENLCRKTIHMGHAQGWGGMEYYPGAYAEYCPAWGDLVYPIPESIPLDEAALADVLCVGVHAVGRAARFDGNVLCIGGGPIGLGAAQVAKARGASRVWVSDPSPIAQSVLAKYPGITPIDPERVPLADALQSVATIYNSLGSAETILESLPLLSEAGVYVNIAVHDTMLHLNAAALGAERVFTSSSNATYSDVAEAYEMICAQRVRMAPMITHRFALEDFAEAFDLLRQSPKQAFKVILNPTRPRKWRRVPGSAATVAPTIAE
jgi:L-iditol 2-dehydrogenase